MSRVIITGGTGLIGRKLAEILREKDYEIAILSRHPSEQNEYKWDPEKQFIDPQAFDNAHTIIHLAGTPVADKHWTDARKKEILDSRVKTTGLLYDLLKDRPHSIRSFISASAVGYYGDGKEQVLTEDAPNGTGFLAEVCRQWEAAADQFSGLSIRVCKLRTGFVLSREGGALPQMALPVKFGLGTYFGNGEQFLPWIHIKDLCGIYMHLLENEKTTGAYNGCAPHTVTNKEMMRSIAKALQRPFIPATIPGFLLKTLMGERSELLLMSDRCSSEKIQRTGFRFSYAELDPALSDIYQNK